jgi:hypothetical protein
MSKKNKAKAKKKKPHNRTLEHYKFLNLLTLLLTDISDSLPCVIFSILYLSASDGGDSC